MPANEEEGFYWIKSGDEKKDESIHSIQKVAGHGERFRRPSSKNTGIANAARAGLRDGWIRATFIVREESLKKLKSLAYRERKGIKDIVDEAFLGYLAGKTIKPVE